MMMHNVFYLKKKLLETSRMVCNMSPQDDIHTLLYCTDTDEKLNIIIIAVYMAMESDALNTIIVNGIQMVIEAEHEADPKHCVRLL